MAETLRYFPVDDPPVSVPEGGTGAVNVLELASSLEGCPVMRIEWYFEACLTCCQGMTPHQLVEAGRAHEVIDFLQRVINHEKVEWRTDLP
jgi:hypothetical protein